MNYDEIIVYELLVMKHTFQTFVFMRYLRRTAYYQERIAQCDLTHMMNMIDPVAIDMETLRTDSGCPSWRKSSLNKYV